VNLRTEIVLIKEECDEIDEDDIKEDFGGVDNSFKFQETWKEEEDYCEFEEKEKGEEEYFKFEEEESECEEEKDSGECLKKDDNLEFNVKEEFLENLPHSTQT